MLKFDPDNVISRTDLSSFDILFAFLQWNCISSIIDTNRKALYGIENDHDTGIDNNNNSEEEKQKKNRMMIDERDDDEDNDNNNNVSDDDSDVVIITGTSHPPAIVKTIVTSNLLQEEPEVLDQLYDVLRLYGDADIMLSR